VSSGADDRDVDTTPAPRDDRDAQIPATERRSSRPADPATAAVIGTRFDSRRIRTP
jgi:hypothetical protein